MDTKQRTIVQDKKSTKHFEEQADLKHAVVENADYTGAEAKTDPAEIALVKKIDWRLMVRFPQPLHEFHLISVQPTLMMMYFLNYVDRNAIAQARLNNLEKDLGMSGLQFNTAVSM
jgi:hypothetical protein